MIELKEFYSQGCHKSNPVDLPMFVEKLKDLFSTPGNDSQVQSCLKWLRRHNDPQLWDIFADEALENGFYDCAEVAFASSKNYSGLKLINFLQAEEDPNVRKGEVCSFLGNLKEAEQYYRLSRRKDLIRSLRKYFPVKHSGFWYCKDSLDDSLAMQMKAEDLYSCGQLSEASLYFKKLEDTDNLLKILVFNDDVDGLKSLAESLPVVPYNFKVFENLTKVLETIGMLSEAMQLHLKLGNADAAVSVALRNGRYQSAIDISKSHDVPIVSEVLLQHTSKMIQMGDLMEAVKFLKLCGKTFAAGKLLAMTALNEIRTQDKPNLNILKKLFTMAGMMLSSRSNESSFNKCWSKKHMVPSKSEILEEIDIRFDQSVPKHLRPTAIELQWMRTKPWRGLHAIQYLILLHGLTYKSYFYKATKIAHHLKAYTDILGNERVHSLLALVSANGQNYSICSNAFYELSKINHDYYEDLASELFSSVEMQDLSASGNLAQCSRCNTKLKDHHALCPTCEEGCSICMLTGEVLIDPMSVWTCGVCESTISLRKNKKHRYCPVCHSKKQ